MQENMREISIIKERILKYLDFKGISKYDCYQKTGISRSVLSQPNGMTEDNILKFLAYYADINTEWLLTGKGEMLKSGETTTPDTYNDVGPPREEAKPEPVQASNSELMIEKICQLSADNALLRRENEDLKSKNEALEHENENLKNDRPFPASVPYDFDRSPVPSLIAETEEVGCE